MDHCKKCEEEITGNYCANCGHPKAPQKINRHYVMTEIGSVLNFEKGFFYTVKELVLRPGALVRKFIFEDRKGIVKPILFLIVCSVIFTLVKQAFAFDNTNVLLNVYDWKKTLVGKIVYAILDNSGYSGILMGVFIAFWVKVFFRKHSYNYYEIYTLLCFIIGISTLVAALFGILESISGYPVFQIGVNIGLLYIVWGIGQFFGKKKVINYIKGLISSVLGMITIIIAFAFLKVLIEWVI